MLGLGAVLALTACAPKPPADTGPRAALTTVVERAGQDGALVTGAVRSLGAHDVAVESAGRLLRYRANIGDRVAAGQVLAELDAEPFRLQASQAREQMRAAAADFDAARREADRLEGLVAAGAASRQDLDNARTSVQRLEAQRRAAADQVGLAARALDKALVRAPAAGVITARQAELGAVLSAGAVLFSLDAGGAREIVAPVSSDVAAQLSPGALVNYHAGAQAGQARLSGLSPRAAGVEAQMARFSIVAGAPTPGSLVELDLVARASRDGDVVLPLSAVLADRSGARRVLVVDAAGLTRAQPVQVLGVSFAGARVRGLAAGQRIVAVGGELIKAGERVRPLPFTP